MKIMPSVIRYILTMALLYGVYTETGIWTTLALLLSVIGIEANTSLIKRRNR